MHYIEKKKIRMYKNKKILGFIPARANSKGIKNKNICTLAGKPLVCHTFESALKSVYLDALVCSTDSDEIASLTQKSGISVIKRPKELALDTSPTIDAVIHTINELKKQGKNYDYLVILQPTSPLRRVEHIDGIIKECLDDDLSGMLSIHKIEYNPILVRFINQKKLTRILNTSSTVRRQDMPEVYYVNGMLWIQKVDLITPSFSFNDIPYGFEVDSKYSIDINTLEDLDYCEQIIRNIK